MNNYSIKLEPTLKGWRVVKDGAWITGPLPLLRAWNNARVMNCVGRQTWNAMKMAQAFAPRVGESSGLYYGHGDVDGWVTP